MADKRDFRIRVDLTLPPEAANHVEQIKAALEPFVQNAVIINEGLPNEERGFIEVERCGHRIGEGCEHIARWEVGRGRVI